ncbi:MAG TPA: GxxExxY protein [Bacteroidales bacterium]|nr:GxxExxY protein [Bacteroidales bacterium]
MNTYSSKVVENCISNDIIKCAIEIHKNLGPGLLESVYETVLAVQLREIGYNVESQVPLPLVYKETKYNVGFRIDLFVEGKVIVEVKSVDQLAPVHFAQLLTYLRLSGKKLGLLINFNTVMLKDGIKRVANQL